MVNKKLKGSLLLLLTAFIWGGAFVAQKIGIVQIGPMTFTSARFFISGIALLPFVWLDGRKHSDERLCLTEADRSKQRRILLLSGALCGVFLSLATILQQTGLAYTSAGKAGFITALYIIFVPILGVFRKQKIHPLLWISVVTAAVGLYLLCVKEGFSVNKGDAIILASALLFSVHILVIDHFSGRTNCIRMSCIQFFVASAVGGALMMIFEKPDMTAILACWAPLAYLGVISGALGYTLQILGQKYTEPTVASLIMSTESVFAAIAGALFLSERLTPMELLGCLLVFAAIIWSQVSPTLTKRFRKDTAQDMKM